jgi:hypothetical protein
LHNKELPFVPTGKNVFSGGLSFLHIKKSTHRLPMQIQFRQLLRRIQNPFILPLIALFLGVFQPIPCIGAEAYKANIVIYGGTSAAVVAAVQAKHMGQSVIIVSPDLHLGGLSSGGLGWTDVGDNTVIGGLSRDFYHKVWEHYQSPSAWKWEQKTDYGEIGQGMPAIDGDARTMWIFEPHVAESIFESLVTDNNIEVIRNEWLDRSHGVEMVDKSIVSIKTLSGKIFYGRVFIDATYEGDLMAAAGVSYVVGRESNETYGESWNGVQTGVFHHGHNFADLKISPYIVPDDPESGVLPRISVNDPGEKGSADHRVQAYCFRLCMSNQPENRIPFPKPENYDPTQYELIKRVFDKGWRETFYKFDRIPNFKTDTNNHGPFSSDNIGMNYDYPDASYERRKEIIQEHKDYQMGLLYFIANDPSIPEEVQFEMNQWGLAKDEFVESDHWPHQIYVREARRMIGAYVTTENEILGRRAVPDSIGMGSYTMDSHNVQRYITQEGYVQNEGDIGINPPAPYPISYRSIIPKQEECQNLLVPVCASSSHIAYGSIRMEPVFMILGQSAATAASMAVEAGFPVQEVDYGALRERLLSDGQKL